MGCRPQAFSAKILYLCARFLSALCGAAIFKFFKSSNLQIPMSIVTFTTDWGYSDYYLAALKGSICAACQQQVQLVDVSHRTSYGDDVAAAAYQLRSAWPHFPKGTVHVVGVGSDAHADEALALVASCGQYFICADSGLLSLALDAPESAVAISLQAPPHSTFRMLHVAPTVVAQLVQGAAPSSLGEPLELRSFTLPQPAVGYAPATPQQKPRVESITGHVLHVDKRGNAITDISRQLFASCCEGRRYTIYLHSLRNKVEQIQSGYTDATDGNMVAFFNSTELLEVAVLNGNASRLYNLHSQDNITIQFTDTTK
jgi:S-adenosylmethionine hydrolase